MAPFFYMLKVTRKFMIKHTIAAMVAASLMSGCTSQTIEEARTDTKQTLHLYTLQDITKYPGKLTSKFPDTIAGEGLAQAFDSSLQSKYLSTQSETWIQYESPQAEVIKAYTLTSAGDAPMRDPAHWTLSASNNHKNWKIIDKISDYQFQARGETITFNVENKLPYRYYRLEMKQRGKSAHGDTYLQLADFGLLATTPLPLAHFSINKKIVKIGETITLSNESKNSPTSLSWQIPGASKVEKLDNIGNKIVATYQEPGSYSIGLTTKNEYGQDQVEQKNIIKVLDPNNPWHGFTPPKIIMNYEDTESDGYRRMVRLFPDFKQQIDQVTREVVKKLYNNFSQVPEFEQVEFRLKWMDTLAYRAGDDTNMVIAFSSKYIEERLKEASDETVKYELMGVLWHELVHGFQLFPKNLSYSSQDKSGKEVHAFIEGMADLIRIQAGFHKTRKAKPSESWLGGYTNTGFFLDWIAKNKADDFAYEFNQSAHRMDKWTFSSAIEELTDEPIDKLWQEYQTTLANK